MQASVDTLYAEHVLERGIARRVIKVDGASLEDAQNHILRWCNSFERLPEILMLRAHMATKDWWQLLGAEWTGLDNVAAHSAVLKGLLQNATTDQLRQMMRPHERRRLRALPEQITVYRGCYEFNRHGLSWSLSAMVASTIPTLNRYRQVGMTPLLLTGLVDRNHLVLKLERREQEVVSAAVRVVAEAELPMHCAAMTGAA